MKIVQIITRMDEAGGAQTHVVSLCRSLTESGHTVVLMAGSDNVYHPDIDAVVESYQAIRHLKRNIHMYHDFLAFLEIRKQLKTIKPDLVATHSSKAGIVGRLAAWSLRIPTVFTAHGWAFTDGVGGLKQLVYRMVEKAIGSITDGVITVSHYDYQLALERQVVSKKKLRAIHNGVPDIGRESVPEKEPPILIMVARFAEPKQQSALLDALQEVKGKEWRLWLVGAGPSLQSAKEQAATLGLDGRVDFFGEREDVANLLASSQMFVLLSKWEGLPISILEAMRSGLPIVASDVGGVKETVVNGGNGFLIQRGNRQELIDKLTILLDKPELRKKMGEASKAFYRSHFTSDEMVRRTVGCYEQVMDGRRGGRQSGD